MKRIVIIMAKVPRTGNVKTRLQPFLSAEQCRTLAEAFLSDTINKTQNLADETIIAFTPAREKNYFAENLTLIEQIGADLGEKMFNAFEFVFEKKTDAKVLMIGTDSPTFPPVLIEKAFAALETNSEIVLGKSADGGFYLIGLHKISPRLFENIQWSSPQVFAQITGNIERLNLNLTLLPEWFDVDTPQDLIALRDEIFNNKDSQTIAPATFQWFLRSDFRAG